MTPRRQPLQKKMLLYALVFGFLLEGNHVYGTDMFESLFPRLKCYGSTQKGCNTTLIKAYPELAWSHTKMTKAKTHIFLFTKDNPNKPELLHKCAGGLPPNSKFNPKCRTEIFIPGLLSGVCNFAIYRELANERLKSGCYNVILVDYMWGNAPDPVETNQNAKIVAKQLVIVIRKLKEMYNLTADDFILTGHSSGAHLAAFVGQDEPVGIINGLDPAGILFYENMPLNERLDRGDASCVQVLHVNAGQCFPGFLGVNFTCGDIDVWYNGGLIQPSCYPDMLKSFIKEDYIYAILSLYPALCMHLQVLQFYKASMNPANCQFIGIECESQNAFDSNKCTKCGVNGLQCFPVGAYGCDCANASKHKNLYLRTDLLCPYCDNKGVDTSGVTCGTTPPSE